MTAAFGPRLDGEMVRFSLWAPDADEVWLELPGGVARKMARASEPGWPCSRSGLAAATAFLKHERPGIMCAVRLGRLTSELYWQIL